MTHEKGGRGQTIENTVSDSMGNIDLRSDTVTQPTPEMRRAMSVAEVGDDVFGEDPTVNRLEDAAAALFGKEAALFISSGTMGNLLGLLVNARPGEEVIADADAHLFMAEGAGAAALGGIQVRQIITERGVMTPEQIAGAARPRDDIHQPPTALLCIENTHNRHGGIAWPLKDLVSASDEAHRLGMKVHLDGARIFNAAIALQTDVAEICAMSDTMTFCLSKGLACPAGSLFLGGAQAVESARRWRKALGGGMRQSGVLAAAGLLALDTMVQRLAQDHANARRLAQELAQLDGINCDLTLVQTNIVIIELIGMSGVQFAQSCCERGLFVNPMGGRRVRFVTHYGIDAADIDRAIEVVASTVGAP